MFNKYIFIKESEGILYWNTSVVKRKGCHSKANQNFCKWLKHTLMPIANQCCWQFTLQPQDFEGLMVSDIKTKAVENRHINHTGQKIMNCMPSVV